MIINAQQLTDWDATYLSATTPEVNITNYVDWLDNAARYSTYRSSIKYSKLELKLLVEGSTPAEKETNISNLINAMVLNNGVYHTDGTRLATTCQIDLYSEKGYYFDGYYESHTEDIINARASEVTFTLVGQKLLPAQSATLTGSGTFYVNGNCEIPVNITFTASSSGTATIYVNNVPYKMDITSGKTYKINGFYGDFTADDVNDIVNYKSYSFPILKSGTNNIVFTSGLISSITFDWNGRLM